MSRYIDADALINKLDERCDAICQWTKKEREVMCGACPLATAFDVVEDFPTADVVEVVRCCDADKGDCMFNHWHTTPNGEKYHICNLNKLSFSEHADFYCAYGERKKDATQD